MANRNFPSAGKIYSGHMKPVMLDCTFSVLATDPKGISSLKGPLIQNIFMHTSASPANAGVRNLHTPNIPVSNPNPANGIIVMQLQDSYNRAYTHASVRANVLSGSDVKIDNAALTPGIAYTISILGDATAATWQGVGLPAGVTPAVGVSFIASAAGGAGNTLTSRVQAPATTSTVASVEMVGSVQVANQINPNIIAQGFGAQLIFQCRDFAGAVVAPPNGSQIMLQVLLSDSSVLVGGE